MKSIIMFFQSLNGVFVPKSPMDNPAFADFYASVMDVKSTNSRDIKRSLRNDMAAFGADFKKVTKMAKELYNVQ